MSPPPRGSRKMTHHSPFWRAKAFLQWSLMARTLSAVVRIGCSVASSEPPQLQHVPKTVRLKSMSQSECHVCKVLFDLWSRKVNGTVQFCVPSVRCARRDLCQGGGNPNTKKSAVHHVEEQKVPQRNSGANLGLAPVKRCAYERSSSKAALSFQSLAWGRKTLRKCLGLVSSGRKTTSALSQLPRNGGRSMTQ